jgi:large subunit ribosomal protein L22
MSARKMRLVVDTVRGKSVDEALNILKYTKQEAGKWIDKLILSAVANWENKNDMLLNAEDFDLIVKTAFVDNGTMLKRFRPAPHGRAHRIRKRTNHVTLVVENRVPTDSEQEVIVETETE